MVFRKLYFFFERKILPGYKIGKTALVIDIGSGDKPFWRANYFLDNLSLDNSQRWTNKNTVQSVGKFINGDITKTKFKDKAFDFSFCSHVLEHVKRPDLAIKEIMRISKAGYIEVPNGVIEYINPFSSHLWFIFNVNSKLIFFRKSKRLHGVLTENSIDYKNVVNHIKEPFIRLYWKDKIDFEITDNNDLVKKFNPLQTIQIDSVENREKNIYVINRKSLYIYLVKLLRKLHGINNVQSTKHLLK